MHGVFHKFEGIAAVYGLNNIDNNHIRTIEGLNNNIKLNILSLGTCILK
jgi:hypothetical protein